MVTDLLVLKLGENPAAPVVWGAFASGGLVEAGAADSISALGGLRERFDASRVVAVMPGEQVALRPLDAPPRAGARLAAAARMLLEDELAEPIEDLHIVVGARGASAIAAAVSKSTLRRWLEALDGAGLSVSELTADFLAAPCAAGECVLIADGERIIATRGDAGFAADGALAAALAVGIIRSAPDARIIGYGDQGRIAAIAGPAFDPRPLFHAADLLTLYAQAFEKGRALDFLTGPFRRRKPGGFRFAPFRRAAIFAGGAIAAALAVFIAGAVRDAGVAARYEERAREIHKSAFPEAADADMRVHARAILAQGRSTATFIDLNAALAESVAATPGLAVDRVRYEAANGRFSFSVRSATDTAIEALRSDLAARGVAATDEGGYRRSGQVWVGEMTARRS